MQLTYIQLPGVQTNLSCLQPVSLLQPATAIKAINPSAEDDCDWFVRQTINLFLSHYLFCCGCTTYHEKVSVVIVPPEWNNRVIRQSAFDLGRQLIHLPICLNYFPWNGYKRQNWTFHSFSGDNFIVYLLVMPQFFDMIQIFFVTNSGNWSINSTPVQTMQPPFKTRSKNNHASIKSNFVTLMEITFSTRTCLFKQ